jgi:hypothetical protein
MCVCESCGRELKNGDACHVVIYPHVCGDGDVSFDDFFIYCYGCKYPSEPKPIIIDLCEFQDGILQKIDRIHENW